MKWTPRHSDRNRLKVSQTPSGVRLETSGEPLSIKTAQLIKTLRANGEGQEAQIAALTDLTGTLSEQNGTLTTQYEGVLEQNATLQGQVTRLLELLDDDVQATREDNTGLRERNGDLKTALRMAEVDAEEANRRARRNMWLAVVFALLLVVGGPVGAYALYNAQDSVDAAVVAPADADSQTVSILIGDDGYWTVNADGTTTFVEGSDTWTEAECLAWWYAKGPDGNVRITHRPLNERNVCSRS